VRHAVNTIEEMQKLLLGYRDNMRVEVETGIAVTAKTAADLRALAAWPESERPPRWGPRKRLASSAQALPIRAEAQPRSARFTYLVDDSYGLLDHLNSDGFDCGNDGRFRRGLLRWS
jgi:hypothetical protein